MRPRLSDGGARDHSRCQFSLAEPGGSLPDVRMAIEHPDSAHALGRDASRQAEASTQYTTAGTQMLDRSQVSDAALKDSLARTGRGVAAAARRWLSASGAPFAHAGHHIPMLSRSETRSATNRDSSPSAPAAQQTPSQTSPEQGRSSAAGCLSSCRCSQRGLGEADAAPPRFSQEAADSARQPGAAQQGTKKRRRASAHFACASAGAEDSPPQGEWRWPQLPKWKPPR